MVFGKLIKNSSLPLDTLSEPLRLTIHASLRSHWLAPPVSGADERMLNGEAMAQLKYAVLSAQTLADFYALMEDYSYLEFMQVYSQLTPKQQAQLNEICDRDTQMQLAALNTTKISEPEVLPATF